MPSQHIWTEKTPEGLKREVRATKFGGAWRLQAKSAGDLDWTYYKQPLLEDLLTLKEILDRKYQRRRASSEDVASVQKLIAEQTDLSPPRHSLEDGELPESHGTAPQSD